MRECVCACVCGRGRDPVGSIAAGGCYDGLVGECVSE